MVALPIQVWYANRETHAPKCAIAPVKPDVIIWKISGDCIRRDRLRSTEMGQSIKSCKYLHR